jgi:hypothetical protein
MKYYIGTAEMPQVRIIKLAFDFGWRSPDKRLMEIDSAIITAIGYLQTKGVTVTTSPVNFPEAEKKSSPEIAVDFKPSNDKCVICFFNEGIYEVDTNYMGAECWDIQMFGSAGCVACPDKGRPLCYGGICLTGDVNSFGHSLPIAKRIGSRPIREKHQGGAT